MWISSKENNLVNLRTCCYIESQEEMNGCKYSIYFSFENRSNTLWIFESKEKLNEALNSIKDKVSRLNSIELQLNGIQ